MDDFINNISLKFDYEASSATLVCHAKRYDFNLKVTYSNVRLDSQNPSDLSVYINDFIEEFQNSLDKHVEIFYEV